MISEVRSMTVTTMKAFRIILDPHAANGHDFVEMIIDENNKSFTARLYGGEVYTHSWGAPGNNFIKFLVTVFSQDDDYLFGKIADHSKEDIIDMEKTVVAMKKKILKNRFDHTLSEEEARDAYDKIEEEFTEIFHTVSDMSLEHFYSAVGRMDLPDIFATDEPWYEESFIKGEDHKARIFTTLVAPILAKVLKQEYPDWNAEVRHVS